MKHQKHISYLGLLSLTLALGLATQVSANEKQRIKEGVRSGEITRNEAKRLKGMHKERKAEKKVAKADGVVTDAEKAKLKEMKKNESKAIFEAKHNEEKQPSVPNANAPKTE